MRGGVSHGKAARVQPQTGQRGLGERGAAAEEPGMRGRRWAGEEAHVISGNMQNKRAGSPC